MVVILLGPPGVGKGTQAGRLADAMGWEHVATGDLLRAARRDGTDLGRAAQAFMDTGELVPDSLILDLVHDHLRRLGPHASVIFDGFPRTVAQAESLEAVLGASGRKVDRAVVFGASEDSLVRRLSGRRSCPRDGAVYNVHTHPPAVEGVCDRCGSRLVHRADDDPETVRRRLEVHKELTEPLIAWYVGSGADVVHVDADRPMDDVYEMFRLAAGTAEVAS
jgi:adenylate kinase